MLSQIKDLARKVGVKLGLVKDLRSLTEYPVVGITDEFYNEIIKWRELYRGYHDEWHDVKYQTIEGPKKRRMQTMNLPKVASEEMATLIFNERCSINISTEGLAEGAEDQFEKDIHAVLKDNNFNANFQSYLEYMFAMGGMVIKPYIKDDKIKLSYVTAPCFLPISWDNVRVTEGVFVNEYVRQGEKFVQLEWHTWEEDVYVITNEVYESKDGINLGSKQRLQNHFPDLTPRTEVRGLDLPMFAYFKPNTANNIDLTSPLGVPIYNNAIDTMKSLDIAFDSFQREFRLGRKRLIVPASAVRTVLNPESGELHRYFDATDESYEAFNVDEGSGMIQEINSTLRVEEHIGAINSLLNLFAMQTGFSTGAFSFNGQSMKTATEVVSEQAKTFRTKQSHENIIEQSIADLVYIIGQTAQLYGMFDKPEGYEINVMFDDSIANDRMGDIQEQILLKSNGLQSSIGAIEILYGMSYDEAVEKWNEIKAESQIGSADVIDFVGKSTEVI